MTYPDHIKTLAEIVKAARTAVDPKTEWNRHHIADQLLKAELTRTPDQLARDAIHAAIDPDVKSPGAIPIHYAPATSGECGACAAREARQHPPKAARCSTCDRVTEACRCGVKPVDADWHDQRRALEAEYRPQISAANRAGDRAEAVRLKTEWKNRLQQLGQETTNA